MNSIDKTNSSKVEIKPLEQGNGLALIPFLVFILIYLGAGIYMQAKGVEMAFYQFPAPVAIAIGVVVAFAMLQGTIDEKFTDFIKGCGEENIMIMCIIYLLAGAFATVSKAMGGVDATVNLGLSLIPAQFMTAGIFLIACFLSLATGTSMGTIGAIAPIALGVADKAGLNIVLVMAAVIGGSMFGDNLSIISDTTIAATRTQGVEMRDKFRMNFLIALPAAAITFVLLLIFGNPETIVPLGNLEYSLIKVVPYMLVLIMALVGVNVFIVLTAGIFAAGLIGVFGGELTLFTFAQNVYSGFTSMNEVFFLSLMTGGLAFMVTKRGGLQWILYKIQKLIRGPKSAQVGIAAINSVADLAVANNTIAIIITGSIAKGISKEYKVDLRRVASLLDISACVFQGLIPYGAQILLVGSLSAGAVSPVALLPFLWYQWLLAIFAIISIFVPFADGIIRKEPWDWEKETQGEVITNSIYPQA